MTPFFRRLFSQCAARPGWIGFQPSSGPSLKLTRRPLPRHPPSLLTIESVPSAFPKASAAPRRRVLLFHAPAPLRLWHLLSLDAPTVAVVWSLAFAWAAGLRLPAWVPALQFLAAWVVYVADRLLDARTALRTASPHRLRPRHRFHWRHRRALLPLAALAACAALWIVLALMPPIAQERNSVLAAAALLYLTGVHSGRRFQPFSKEFLVGLLFTAGCALPTLTRALGQPGPLDWALPAALACFAALAWLNCRSIDRWESRVPQPSLRSTLSLANLLALAGLLLALLFCPAQPRAAALLAAGALGAFLLGLLDRFRSRLTPVTLRAAADLVLLTPALLLPFALLHP